MSIFVKNSSQFPHLIITISIYTVEMIMMKKMPDENRIFIRKNKTIKEQAIPSIQTRPIYELFHGTPSKHMCCFKGNGMLETHHGSGCQVLTAMLSLNLTI